MRLETGLAGWKHTLHSLVAPKGSGGFHVFCLYFQKWSQDGEILMAIMTMIIMIIIMISMMIIMMIIIIIVI